MYAICISIKILIIKFNKNIKLSKLNNTAASLGCGRRNSLVYSSVYDVHLLKF